MAVVSTIRNRAKEPDQACADAVDLARRALAEEAGVSPAAVGDHLGAEPVADRVVTHLFECADKAYAGNPCYMAVEKHNAALYTTFPARTTGSVGGPFAKAFHYFQFKKDEYLAHYHLRSNVESTVSMVKRKFGDAVKAKGELAQKNEVYAKFVCHNLCVLIQEMYTLGIEAIFGEVDPATPRDVLRFPAGG